jgi:hypothetical protein
LACIQASYLPVLRNHNKFICEQTVTIPVSEIDIHGSWPILTNTKLITTNTNTKPIPNQYQTKFQTTPINSKPNPNQTQTKQYVNYPIWMDSSNQLANAKHSILGSYSNLDSTTKAYIFGFTQPDKKHIITKTLSDIMHQYRSTANQKHN